MKMVGRKSMKLQKKTGNDPTTEPHVEEPVGEDSTRKPDNVPDKPSPQERPTRKPDSQRS